MTPSARAARVLPPENWPSDVWANRRKALAKEFEEVAREEREACAALAETQFLTGTSPQLRPHIAGELIAAAIRARAGGT